MSVAKPPTMSTGSELVMNDNHLQQSVGLILHDTQELKRQLTNINAAEIQRAAADMTTAANSLNTADLTKITTAVTEVQNSAAQISNALGPLELTDVKITAIATDIQTQLRPLIEQQKTDFVSGLNSLKLSGETTDAIAAQIHTKLQSSGVHSSTSSASPTTSTAATVDNIASAVLAKLKQTVSRR